MICALQNPSHFGCYDVVAILLLSSFCQWHRTSVDGVCKDFSVAHRILKVQPVWHSRSASVWHGKGEILNCLVIGRFDFWWLGLQGKFRQTVSCVHFPDLSSACQARRLRVEQFELSLVRTSNFRSLNSQRNWQSCPLHRLITCIN